MLGKDRMNQEKKIVIIAGPNGAGKTTFANEYLPKEAGCPIFINADLIAAGLSPFQPDKAALKAGKLMLNEIRERVRKRDNFAIETTLSGLMYARLIPEWRQIGYHVKLVYLSLPLVELAISRVIARVAEGGHSVPEDLIRQRFAVGLKNFHEVYKPLVNFWIHYDNSYEEPIIIDQGGCS